MKKLLVFILLVFYGVTSFAQDSLVAKSTKSYLIADGNPKDTAFLKEK